MKIECVCFDSISVKVHPDGMGTLKKNGVQSIGKSRAGWTTKIHMLCYSATHAVTFALSAGNDHDALPGRELLTRSGQLKHKLYLLMDRAYKGDQTRQLARDLEYEPIVPHKTNRLEPWTYDKQLHQRRNEVERLFCRLKAFRRIFSRFDKLNVIFCGFIYFALIFELLRFCVNTP